MYTVNRKSENVAIVHIPFTKSFEQCFLLSADRHWDHPHSDHALQKKHLDQARRRGAGILDFGDLFCAMQGKGDRRGSKLDVRSKHQKRNYFDAIVDDAAEFFVPYANNFVVIGTGNHESKILEQHETCLVSRLVEKLRAKGSNVYAGGYSGWVIFQFHDDIGRRTIHKRLWYFHGSGGGGPVTKGVNKCVYRAAYLPDADILVSGHIHESWCVEQSRQRCAVNGKLSLETQTHVQLPTYKEEYSSGAGGWHVESGKPPKPTGAAWLTFRKPAGSGHIEFDVTRAR